MKQKQDVTKEQGINVSTIAERILARWFVESYGLWE